MAITLGAISVDLLANTGGFIEGMTKASQQAKKASKEITDSFSKMGDAAEGLLAPFGEIGAKIGEAFGGLGNTFASVTKGLSGMAGGASGATVALGGVAAAAAALGIAGAGIAAFAADAANKFFEMSEKTGISVETLSAFSYAAGLSGVSSEELSKGLEKLNKSAFAAATAPAGAVNAYTRLGIAVKDASGEFRPTEDILLDVSEKFANMPNGVVKGALAMQLFGRAGAEMIPFLNEGKEGIAALKDEADKFGITLSGKTAEGAHQFEQSLKRVQGALMGAANSVMKELLPSMEAFADFIISDLKDPSGVFREIGSVILNIVVPAFKILGSAIAIAVTAGDYFVSVLTHGIDFATRMVIGLGRAISDVGSGHFKEAGNELRQQFHDGLNDFTKGVTEDTDKASKRLQDFFGKTLFGQDAFKEDHKPKGSNGEVNTSTADKSNPITERIQKLQEAATAEEKLAGAVNLSTAAIRAQTEANEADKVILELTQIALKKHLDFTNADKDAVRQAVIAAGEFKAAFQVRDEIQKQTLQLGLNTDKVNALADAYLKGGTAILDTEAKISAIPLQEKVNELSASIAENTTKFGANSDKVKALTGDLKAAQSELDNFIQTVKRSKEADAAEALAKNFNSLQSAIAGLKITGDAIGGTTEQLRQAQVQAQLAQYELTHIGVDKHSKEWIEYAAGVEEASKKTEENRIKSEALRFDLQNTFKNAITQLQIYREKLQEMGADTTAIDAAIVQENQKVQKSYAQNLLTIGGFTNGAKAFFIEFTNDGKNAATAIFDALKVAFDGLDTQLTDLIVKGKANFKQLGQDIETSLVKSGIHSLEQNAVKGLSSLFPGLGGLFGGGSKPDGTKNNALWVQMATPFEMGGGSLPLPNLSGLINLGGGGGGTDSSGGGGLFGGGGGIGGIFKSIGSLFGSFGGFLAGGGDVQPGRAYMVGEKRPELFVPRSAGTIVPSLKSGDGSVQHITNNNTFHISTPDADSFKKSQGQISSAMGMAAQRGFQRNGR
jgi:hypothetical protein